MGKLLSIEAVKLAKEIYPNPYDVPNIKVKTDSLHFIGRHDKNLKYNVHFSVISINNRIAIATVPGEPFIKFQIDWKRKCNPIMLFLSSSDIPGTTEDGRCICLIFDRQLMVASEQMKDRGLLKSEQVKRFSTS